MTALRDLTGGGKMRLSILLTILLASLVASPGHAGGPQGFGSSLISCPNQDICGTFYNTLFQEPLNGGTATTQLGGPGGSVKVKVDGALPNVAYDVRMISSTFGPPFGTVVGVLSTDINGDGVGNYPLIPDAYLTGVQLWRDSDGLPNCLPFLPLPLCTPGNTEPRIVTGFIVTP